MDGKNESTLRLLFFAFHLAGIPTGILKGKDDLSQLASAIRRGVAPELARDEDECPSPEERDGPAQKMRKSGRTGTP